MFSEALLRFPRTLALRLTIWYAVIFAASSAIAFAVLYSLLVTIVEERTDEDLIGDVEDLAELIEDGGMERVLQEIDAEMASEGTDQVFFRLWSPQGRELLATDLSDWRGIDRAGDVIARVRETGEPVLKTFALEGREHPARTVAGEIAPGVIVEIGEYLEDDSEFIETFFNGFLLTLLVVVALGAPVGWLLARAALRGVQEITRTATEIAEGALDRRVTVRSGGDELNTLARAFNSMLDRIQTLIIGMREMTDNLAHDLKSPLGRIRASAETAMSSAGTNVAVEAMAATTTEECDRLLEMINTTLDIAEAESGAARLQISEVDLAALVRDAVELFQPIAEDKHVRVSVQAPEHCTVKGDRQRLQRVVANLLDNALKYIPADGTVYIVLSVEGDEVRLSVEDTGIGMSPEESARVFERFYRCDRSRSLAGNGLGLSLALAFARAHGGDIRVASAPGKGSRFTAVLPAHGAGPGYAYNKP